MRHNYKRYAQIGRISYRSDVFWHVNFQCAIFTTNLIGFSIPGGGLRRQDDLMVRILGILACVAKMTWYLEAYVLQCYKDFSDHVLATT